MAAVFRGAALPGARPDPAVPPGTARPLPFGLLVDQYGRGAVGEELGLGAFERRLAAATGCALPARGTLFDSAVGLALRRWCPPLLGLGPHCSPAVYLARRRELGAYASGRALLQGTGVDCFLVAAEAHRPGGNHEFGHPGGTAEPCGTAGPCEAGEGLAEAARGVGRTVRETVRLETLAEQVADTSGTVRAFVANTAEALHGAARGAAAFVCEAGFREAGPPGLAEVHRAAGRWLAGRARDAPGHPLCREPALLRHVLWGALVTGRPVQLTCHDPQSSAGFLRAAAGVGTAVVLLPRPGHHPAAARLAAAFPHVYADAGPRPAETLAEAPFGKLLFSTRARLLPELYVVRAREFAAELARVLSAWTADGRCSAADARRIGVRVAGGNARALYGFPEAGAGDGAGAGVAGAAG